MIGKHKQLHDSWEGEETQHSAIFELEINSFQFVIYMDSVVLVGQVESVDNSHLAFLPPNI